MAEREQNDMGSFLGGLIVGLVLSAPLAAWLSPRSGAETRQAIVQRGVILRRRVADRLRKPVAQVQEQLEHLRGVSVSEALAEGRAIAARHHHLAHGEPTLLQSGTHERGA